MAKIPTTQQKKRAQPNQPNTGKDNDPQTPAPATPSYAVMHEEMNRLLGDLTTIARLGRDASGDLSERAKAQVEAAVRELRNCRDILICIQGHSPYTPAPPKKQ